MASTHRISLLGGLLFGLVLGGCAGATASDPPPAARAPAIGHVFVIVLENQDFASSFGPDSRAPYLSRTLPAQGALLRQYYATGHASLDNYIAMISGQAASPQTRADCQYYADFKSTGTTADGQAIGDGCVYPASVKTLADQLAAAGLRWKGYMEDMGNDPARESATCGHPRLGDKDLTHTAQAPSAAVPAGDQYATRHNPFVYFHSIVDSPACAANVVNLRLLPQDLQSADTTANFNFITPNLCNDGHDAPCADRQPGGLVSADRFLQKWVPLITASPAFRKDGLLVVLFDEGGYTLARDAAGRVTLTFKGEFCCAQQPGPNLTAFPQVVQIRPTITLVSQSYGGDRVGAVLLSPLIAPGTVSDVPYNHYSLLRSVEDWFGLGHLGYAAQPEVAAFGKDVFAAQ
ncbi:MAG: phosphoesterase [Nevskia sp.]|nr:phosphoesterase [Nevskia sp.]